MSTILYTALERFTPGDGETWNKFIEWSKLTSIKEIISLDNMLCHSAVEEYSDTDWKYQSEEITTHGYFTELQHVINKKYDQKKIQIIALVRNPENEGWIIKLPEGFQFKGYDLIDDETLVSALSNCGGFPETFANSELNEYGLISMLDRAKEIRNRLKANNPDESHADCEIYGLARLEKK